MLLTPIGPLHSGMSHLHGPPSGDWLQTFYPLGCSICQLVNGPICSVSENPDNSPEVHVYSPFIGPSQNSMRDHCDIIS